MRFCHTTGNCCCADVTYKASFGQCSPRLTTACFFIRAATAPGERKSLLGIALHKIRFSRRRFLRVSDIFCVAKSALKIALLVREPCRASLPAHCASLRAVPLEPQLRLTILRSQNAALRDFRRLVCSKADCNSAICALKKKGNVLIYGALSRYTSALRSCWQDLCCEGAATGCQAETGRGPFAAKGPAGRTQREVVYRPDCHAAKAHSAFGCTNCRIAICLGGQTYGRRKIVTATAFCEAG